MAKGAVAPEYYHIVKMRFGKTKRDGKTVDDKAVIVYNEFITVSLES